MNRHIILSLLWVLTCSTAFAQEPENLAAGKPYTLDPAPSYQLCTDAADKVQLTDGLYSEGYFWTQMTTVGWVHAQPVTITIDLQSVQPINGLSFNSAAGTAGVEWPESISILTSDDGKTHYFAGDLVELSAVETGQPKPQGYGIHRFATAALRTHGRYVTLVILCTGPYLFVDEIEVQKGSAELLRSAPAGKPFTDTDDFFKQSAVTRGIRRRLRLDLAEVRELARNCNQTEKWTEQFERIQKEIAALEFDPPENFRTVLPIGDVHKQIFKIQAALWRHKGLADLVIWQKNRWDMLSPTELPRTAGAEIDVEMMSNEYRGAAFNISNPDSEAVRVAFAIKGLPEDTNPPWISVHEVPFTDTRSGIPVAAAMPRLQQSQGNYCITVEPGMTKQIWLNFHPGGIPAGNYKASIQLDAGRRSIPLRLKIHPLEFPDRPTLQLGGWDYTDLDHSREVTPENRSALIEHLREHYVDCPWATSRVLQRGKYDKQGNMTEEPDPKYFGEWIKLWPDARNYYVFASLGDTFEGLPVGGAPFEKAVAAWIKWWSDKLGDYNLKGEQLGILLVDEPHSFERDDLIIAYADVINRAAPEVVVWEDPTWSEPWNARRRLFEVSDALCPNLPMLITEGEKFAEFYVRQRESGKQLWLYSCSGPGKLLDPYSYHRLQQWFCFKYGAIGSAFWAFGDSNGASTWNEYLSLRGAYTPVFLDEKTVTAGKHMEAIREGVQDYEYLVMLRDRITHLEEAGKTNPAITKAKTLLANAADRVVASQTPEKLNWSGPKDRSVADQVRIEILRTLTELSDL